MSLSDEQWVFVQDEAKLINYAKSLGFKLTSGRAYTIPIHQKYFYDKGLSKTLKSGHVRRLARDFNVFYWQDGKWHLTYNSDIIRPLGDFWKALDEKNIWGGDFGKGKKSGWDAGHFERRV